MSSTPIVEKKEGKIDQDLLTYWFCIAFSKHENGLLVIVGFSNEEYKEYSISPDGSVANFGGGRKKPPKLHY